MESVSVPRLFFLLPLALSLSLLNPFQAKAVDIIAHTCDHSVFRDLCLTTLRSNLNSKNADLKGLGVISIQNTMATATNVSSQISALLNVTIDDPFIQQCLSDCSQSYVEAIDQLVNSLASLEIKNYNDVNKALSASMTAVELCQDSFSAEPGHVPLLRDSNTKFTQLCSNALSITNQLAGSPTPL
ncbi:pectinesterase inhibitor-like [Telopea speciosissima]|uniref:pectinesterase inhibitor-like n=1 Tax=Telopea speciosissima TaxID=54955 RepID=UPI001CC6C60C|nr:pectinesterase inhibitor-like [Telopea speciosissima]